MKRFNLKFAILSTVLILSAVISASAQKPWRISRPCPGSTTPASVSIATDGSISISTCSGKFITFSGLTSTNFGTGDITTAGNITSTGGNISTTTGNITSAGNVNGTTITSNSTIAAATNITATAGTITSTAGGVTLRDTLAFSGTGTGNITLDRTITAGGTTGNQTINKMAGTVNIAAAASSVTITNSKVSANSLVFPVIRTNDATCTSVKSSVSGSGSVVITLNANCTAETSVGFVVYN